MGHSGAFHVTRQPDLDEPELRLGDLAEELLLPIEAVRLGVALVRRGTPRASEVIEKIDATMKAMERIVDELSDIEEIP
jgi:hypothetical protein